MTRSVTAITFTGSAMRFIRILFTFISFSFVALTAENDIPEPASVNSDSIVTEALQTDADTLPAGTVVDTIIQNADQSSLQPSADSLSDDSLVSTVNDSDSVVAVTDTALYDSTAYTSGFLPGGGPSEDTTIVNEGTYFSAGFGWSLGTVKIVDLWQYALPDSLGSFSLTSDAFAVPYDSAGPESQTVDTALIAFSVKEQPAPYSMCFPLSLSLMKIRKNGFHSFSLTGSWMRKVYSATIATPNDSLDRKVDYIESINHYSLFASIVYGIDLPEYYFHVEGIERTSFTIGLELSPLLATMINRKVSAPSDDERFIAIKNRIKSPRHRFIHGTAAAGRIGLSMIKRMDRKNAVQYGIWYSLQWNGYFKEHDERVSFNDIAPAYQKKDKLLSWFSSRFELTIAILHHVKK